MLLDENLDENKRSIKLTDKEIFVKIWTSPRMVFKYIQEYHYDKYVTLLLILGGISSSFDRASTKSMGDNLSLISVIAICVIAGGLFGWIGYYLYSALLSWTGKWINGKGNTSSIIRMSAYAMIPSILALVMLIPQIVLFGNGIFQSTMNVYGDGIFSTIIFYASVSLEVILGLWTLVLYVIGISEIQKFSIWKAILNMILAILVILVPIFLIVFAVQGF